LNQGKILEGGTTPKVLIDGATASYGVSPPGATHGALWRRPKVLRAPTCCGANRRCSTAEAAEAAPCPSDDLPLLVAEQLLLDAGLLENVVARVLQIAT
jgi:hypothetical protein